jgi:hypothetical protein
MGNPWEEDWSAPAAAAAAPAGNPWEEDWSKVDTSPGVAGTVAGLAKAGGTGLVKGAAGFVGQGADIGSLLGLGVDKVAHLLNLAPDQHQTLSDLVTNRYSPEEIARRREEYMKGLDDPAMAPYMAQAGVTPGRGSAETSAEVLKGTGIEDALHKAATPAERYVENVGALAPAALTGGEGVAGKLANVARFAIAPGVAGEAAGDLAKGSMLEPYAKPVVELATGALAPKAITPIAADAERLRNVRNLQDAGVPLTASQITGSRKLGYLESILANTPFAGKNAERINEQQGSAFTRAALRPAGILADRATPEVIDGAFDRIGGDFDRLAANNELKPDRRLMSDLINAHDDYASVVQGSQHAPVVGDTLNDVINSVATKPGTISGAAYQDMRSRLMRLSRGTDDPKLSQVLHDYTDALDSAMERSIARTNPDDTGAFQRARRQYRNMLVIERAASAPGAASANGFLTPAQLSSAVKQLQGRRAYARGQGDFAELARAGQGSMTPLPDSGTAQRTEMMHLLELSSVLGGESGNTGGTLAGLVRGVAIPATVGRVLMSRPVQGYLGNQVLPQVPGLLSTNPGRLLAAREARGLLSQQSQQ